MLIAILAAAGTKSELLAKGFHKDVEVLWVDTLSSLAMVDADCYFDLAFEMDPERNLKLARFTKPLFISAMNDSLHAIGNNKLIRINTWPGMISRNPIELVYNDDKQGIVVSIFNQLGWEHVQVPDLPGFLTARIIVTIINEAYFALGEQVSDKSAIDLAMKTGTNYPFGPFEWAEKIGLHKILALLKSMNAENFRYEPAPLLVNEIAAHV